MYMCTMRCEIWAQPAELRLSCVGSSVGRALCLEYIVSWVRVPPEAAHFFLGKVTALGVLCCFALFVCLTLLASFFLPSHLSFKNMYSICTCTCTSYVPSASAFHDLLLTRNAIIRGATTVLLKLHIIIYIHIQCTCTCIQ